MELRPATWPLWATWLVGPASFGAAFLYCATFTDRSIDRTSLLLACGLVVTHVAAGLMTIALAFVPGLRSAAEFWALMMYWAGVACLLAIPIISGFDPPLAIPVTGVQVAAGAASLMPLLAVVRLIARIWRRN